MCAASRLFLLTLTQTLRGTWRGLHFYSPFLVEFPDDRPRLLLLEACCKEVLKHEDSQLEVTSLEVRYRVDELVEDNLEELSK